MHVGRAESSRRGGRLRELATNLLLSPFVLLGVAGSLVYLAGYAAWSWWSDLGDEQEGGQWMGEGKRTRAVRGGAPAAKLQEVSGTVAPERYASTQLVCRAGGRGAHTGPREPGAPRPTVRAPVGCECPRVLGRTAKVVLVVRGEHGGSRVLQPVAPAGAPLPPMPEEEREPARVPMIPPHTASDFAVKAYCRPCGGAGWVPVGADAFNPSGRRECTACRGRGVPLCAQCRGSGQMPVDGAGGYRACDWCEGTGVSTEERHGKEAHKGQ